MADDDVGCFPIFRRRSTSTGSRTSGDDSVLKQGFLVKQGHFVRNWKRRSFVLTGEDLKYYESEDASDPKGTISLKDISSINVNPRRRSSFEIKTVTGKDFTVLASNETEKAEWIRAIQKALTKPSKLAQVLRQASEYERNGKINNGQKEEIKGLLVSGGAEGLNAAQAMLDEAFPDTIPEPPEAISLLLSQFSSVARTASLVNVLARLAIVVGTLPAHESVGMRMRNIADVHRRATDDRWTDAVETAFQQAIAAFERRLGGGVASVPIAIPGGAKLAGSAGAAAGAATGAAATATATAGVTAAGDADDGGGGADAVAADRSGSLSADAAAGAASAAGAAAGAGASEAALGAGGGSIGEGISIVTKSPEEDGDTVYTDAAGDPISKARSWHMMAGTGDSEFVRANAAQVEAMNAIARGAPLAGIGEDAALDLDEVDLEDGDDDAAADEDVPKFKPSAHFEDDFILGRKIGEGGYSTVYDATHRWLGHQAAVKVVEKKRLDARETAGLHEEVKVMRKLRHPNIVRLEAFYEEEDSYYIVTELMTGGELFDKIVQKSHYTEREAQVVVRTLAKALEYCHRNGIVHRDLKPENILLSSDDEDTAVIKIADMGFARPVLESGMQTSCGTPSYVAPEILLGQRYGTQVDMWSIGVIMYILLCGYAPFSHPNQNQLFRLIIRGNFYFDSPYWDGVSESAKNLIRHLLVVKPNKRYTAKQVLNHPWIAGSVSANTQLNSVLGQMRMFNSRRRHTIKRGYMQKQGNFVRNWKKRFFVLTGEDLQYYENEEATVPKGVIALADVTRVGSAADDGVDTDGREYVFVMYTSIGRDYFLQADSAGQLRDWVRVLTTTHQHLDLMRKAQTAYRAKEMEEAQGLIAMAKQWERMRDASAAMAMGDDVAGSAPAGMTSARRATAGVGAGAGASARAGAGAGSGAAGGGASSARGVGPRSGSAGGMRPG